MRLFLLAASALLLRVPPGHTFVVVSCGKQNSFASRLERIFKVGSDGIITQDMDFGFIFDLIFPPVCLACSGRTLREEALCADCRSKINFYGTLFCGRCGARLPVVASAKSGLPTVKKICHLDHPYILGAAMNYHEPQVEALIKALKFGRAKNAAMFLGISLANYIEPIGLPLDEYLVAPVPLGKERRRERGFNQAELIAECLARKLGLPLESRALSRYKNTLPQSSIRSHKERLSNVTGAFVADKNVTEGKNIILIDDVTTSGATFYEAAGALKSAGARKIIALAAAKA